jgi:hypothetical protein
MMSEVSQELGLELPLAAYGEETRVKILIAWLVRVEGDRLDTILAKFRAVTAGLPAEEARWLWREAFAGYLSLNGGM